MFKSLNSMLFGNGEPDGTGNPASEGNAGDQQARPSQDRRLNTAEEEMGWLLVNVSRSSSPSLCGAQGVDPSLQRPDGTVFDGVLNLSSSSGAEDEDMDENRVMVDFSAQWPSISESFGAEEEDESEEGEVDPPLQRPDGTIFDGVLSLSSSGAEDEDMDENRVVVDFSVQCPAISESSGAEVKDDAEEEDAEEVDDSEEEGESEEGEVDPSLQRPDGTVFDGVLDLSSSGAEDEDMDENRVVVDLSTQCPAISESSGAEVEVHAEEEDAEEEDESEEEEVSEEGDSEEGEVDASSSCSSLSVLSSESSEEECEVEQSSTRRTPEPGPTLTESWMLTPPPCFTGTRVSRPIRSSPLENRLIELSSLYARLDYFGSGRVPSFFIRRRFGLLDVMKMEKEQKEKSRIAEAREQLRSLVDIIRKLSRKASEDQQDISCLDNIDRLRADASAPMPRSVAAVRECCEAAARSKKLVQYQQLRQKAAVVKKINRGCQGRSNKALMAQSCSRSQTSARNRLLRPSGSKCGRFGQRPQ